MSFVAPPPPSSKSGIPRLLHQVYISTDRQLPAALNAACETNRKINPGWKCQLYDSERISDYVKNVHGEQIYSFLKRINPQYSAARADLFRYLVLYKEGGVYLDIKSRCSLPLDQVLRPDESFILSQWRNGAGQGHAGFGLWPDLAHIPGGEYQQWFIAAEPGHPFLRAVIESVLANIEDYSPWKVGTGQIGVLRVTGPIAYTLAIAARLDKFPHRFIRDESEIGLIYSVLPAADHQKLFASHYKFRTDPVVTMHGWRSVAAAVYSILKRSRQRGRSLMGAMRRRLRLG